VNQIRFQVYDGPHLIHETPWTPENTRTDALTLLDDTRKRLGGNFQYRITRTGDSKVPNPVKMYRFKITVGDSLFFSKLLTESEKDEAFAQIKEQFTEEKFPGRQIEEQEI
jgi:hypothetical protein